MTQLQQAETYFSLPYVKEAPRATWSRLLTFSVAVFFDLISIQLGAMLGVLMYGQLHRYSLQQPSFSVLAFSFEYVLIFAFFAYKRDLYKHAHSLLEVRETAEILRVSTLCLVLITLTIYVHRLVVPRLMLLFVWVLVTAILLIQKHATRELITHWKSRHVNKRNVVIVGAGHDARRIFSILTKSPDLGLLPVAFVAENEPVSDAIIYSHDYRYRSSAPVLHESVTSGLLDQLQVSEIYVAQPDISDRRVQEIIALGLQKALPVSFIGTKHLAGPSSPSDVRFLDGLHVTSMVVSERPDFVYIGTKRVFDVIVSALLILITTPIWFIIAVWIKMSSPGPVFFRQQRIKKEGVPFEILKFRSMYTSAPRYGTSPEEAADPRVTSAGRFLRRTSLDELPQLLNVLKGDMSLVGPRPEMPFIVREYTTMEHQRLLVPQGMTGFWQLSADRKSAIHERLEYDLYYLEQKGFFFDLAVLVHTAFFAMKGV